MTNIEALIKTLAEGDVEFILVGGMAGIAHGASRLTQDVDVVYARDDANLDRIARVLQPHKPYLRGAPPGLPFTLDRVTLRNGLNFTLTTTIGDLDLFGEIAGGGGYAALRSECIELEVFGVRCLCLDLPKLIAVKRAAGRPKDFEAIAELELLLAERDIA
jgi:predicted nucleotidyltransferase